MTYGFICYLEALKDLLLILCSLGRNIRGVTAKQMDGAVPIFDPLHCEEYFPHKHLSNLFSPLFPTFTNLTMTNALYP